MTPHNPDEKPEEDRQSTNLRDIREAHAARARASTDQKSQGSTDLTPPLEETPETKAELDRVEAYLKGPTVFSA